MIEYLWRFNAQGFCGLFVASPEAIKNLCGCEIVLEDDGQDYCLTHWVTQADFELVETDLEFIQRVENLGLTPHGFNPLKANVRDNEGFDATQDFWESSDEI